jgi:outer membrane lipopolysaccharide assembly protein LptE/RlpB
VLARTIRQQKEIEGIEIGKEDMKVSLFVDDIIVYISNREYSTKDFLQLKNNFSKVTEYKINSIKSVAFLYTNDKQAEKEIRKTIPFIIATNFITYPGVILIKQVKILYDNNFKSLKKEIEENIIIWRDLRCSWIGRINIVKMAIIRKAVIDSIQSPSKSQHNSSKTWKEQFSNSLGKAKNPE